MTEKIVVFAPHPDDETLACGGTIAKKLKEGYEVHVVFMTDGRHALTEISELNKPSPLEMKTIRQGEAKKAAEILGLSQENLVFLDFEDRSLQENKIALQDKVSKILIGLSPSIIFFPQEKEYNSDHRAANLAIKRAIVSLDLTPIEYQYPIAYSFPFSVLYHIMNQKTFDFVFCKFTDLRLVSEDISDTFALKEMALKEYRSQIELLSDEQKRPVLKSSFLQRFLKTYERFFVGLSNKPSA